MVEKLKYEDGAYTDVVIDRFNELVDAIEALQERIDNHWKFHRIKDAEFKGTIKELEGKIKSVLNSQKNSSS